MHGRTISLLKASESLYHFLIALFLLAAALRLFLLLPDIAYHPEADEGYYLKYTAAVSDAGPTAFPGLAASYIANSSHWQYPHPLRVGYISASAIWGRIFGVSFHSLSSLSIVSFIITIGLNYFFMRRFFGNPQSLLMAGFLCFSPLWSGLALRALTDSFALMLAILTVWLFLCAVSAPLQKKYRPLFVIAFTLAILTRETALLLLGPFLVFGCIEKFYRKRELRIPGLLFDLSVPVLLYGLVVILSAGGFEPFLRIAQIVASSPATNRFAVLFGSGPWYRYIIDFLLLSPFTTLLAISYAGLLAVRLKAGQYQSHLVYLLLLFLMLIAEYDFFTKNLRYIAFLELTVRAFGFLMLQEIAGTGARKLGAAFFAFLCLLCFLDYRTFDLAYIENSLYDPVTYRLLLLRAILHLE